MAIRDYRRPSPCDMGADRNTRNVVPRLQNWGVTDSKKCPRCGLEKSLDQFSWRDSFHTKVQSYCRACSNQAWVDWYGREENRKRHLMLLAKRRKQRIQRHQRIIAELK